MNAEAQPASGPATMLAVRLHGPRDLRVEKVPAPDAPGPGRALLRVRCTGLCGSDLHSYLDARIGDTPIQGPLILGHEFSAVVEAVGPQALDGHFTPLQPGSRVAVDPAQPCGQCELCQKGHPNLCGHLQFCGTWPDGGSLCQWIDMPARSCFPVPDRLDDTAAALLEPLGVAMHAVDLAKVKVGDSLAIVGAGPIGLLILQVARLAGADPIFVTDKFSWRLELAQRWGAIPIQVESEEPVTVVDRQTAGRGVDVVIEAAWGDQSVQQAADLVRLGGRVVLVGIPGDDRLVLNHSTARRKGLTLVLSRRMKHIYPRAIALAQSGRVDLHSLVSHRFALERAPEAFALNAAYQDNVVKVIIQH